jgi:hypothetical protein
LLLLERLLISYNLLFCKPAMFSLAFPKRGQLPLVHPAVERGLADPKLLSDLAGGHALLAPLHEDSLVESIAMRAINVGCGNASRLAHIQTILGAGRHERTADHRGECNGTREQSGEARVGQITQLWIRGREVCTIKIDLRQDYPP